MSAHEMAKYESADVIAMLEKKPNAQGRTNRSEEFNNPRPSLFPNYPDVTKIFCVLKLLGTVGINIVLSSGIEEDDELGAGRGIPDKETRI